jgi:transmembrane sensor
MEKISDELIERFEKGLCTKEEAKAVWEYFHQHPDEKYLLNEFEQTDGLTPLPSGYREEMLAFITAETGETQPADQPKRSFRSWAPVAAAASVLLAITGWYLLHSPRHAGGKGQPVPQLAAITWIDKYNTGKREMSLTLPDNSTVKLFSGTHIRYRQDLGHYDKREVEVTGKAVFEVTKNEQQPFIVSNEGIHTTVLGTTFDVEGCPRSEQVIVKLYEGRVLVSLARLASGNERKDYYLVPGQEFVFSRNDRDVAIHEFGKAKNAGTDLAKNGVKRPDSLSNWYMFNNQNLAEVFDQLSAIYNIEIQYSRKDISNMYFIGKLEKKDSIGKIIHDIALLNHLSVTNHNGGFVIRKNRP